MRHLYYLIALFAISSILSCKSSQDVISNSRFQKRKYRSGWYVEKHKKEEVNYTQHTKHPEQKDSTFQEIPNEIEKLSADVHSSITPIDLNKTVKEKIKIEKPTTTTVSKSDQSNSRTHDSILLKKKKKRKKEKWHPLVIWASTSSALGTWFVGWPVEILAVAIPLYGLGILLAIIALTKLKKSQVRNKRKSYTIIVASILLIVVAFVL